MPLLPSDSRASQTQRGAEGTNSALPTSRRRLLHVGELHLLPAVRWIIKGVLAGNSLGVLYGLPGQGKSFLAFHLGLLIAQGQNFAGRRIKRGLVVFVEAEGVGGLQVRVAGWHQHHGLSDESAAAYVLADAVDLQNNQSVTDLVNAIRRIAADARLSVLWVVFDTLAGNFGGGDENSTQAMNQVVANLNLVRTTLECAVWVVHHQGKAQNGPRGSTVLMGAVDTAAEVERTASGFEMRITKQKEAQAGLVYCFDAVNVVIGTDEEGDPVETLVPVLTGESGVACKPANDNLGSNQAALLAIIQEMGVNGSSREGLYQLAVDRKVVGGQKPRRAFDDALKALIAKGRVETRDDRLVVA